jgi:hypothetical protein
MVIAGAVCEVMPGSLERRPKRRMPIDKVPHFDNKPPLAGGIMPALNALPEAFAGKSSTPLKVHRFSMAPQGAVTGQTRPEGLIHVRCH